MSLSIIIPAYNEEQYLPTLLSSLGHARRSLNDVRSNYPVEVIVVDNCSTDKTGFTALSYSAKVVSENTRNVSTVRNRGASVATGEYLVFIDADYRVEGNFLSGIVTAFEGDPRTVAAGVKVVVEENELDIIQRSVANFSLFLLRKIKRMSFGVFAFRKSFFENLGGFDERFYAYEDVEMHRQLKQELTNRQNHYQLLSDIKAHASARGFHRGGMFTTYTRMFLSPKSRKDLTKCGYWYDR